MSKTIALAGNPNSGKTTLFNALTGSNQHVGNWPGVTVEKKEGSFKHKGQEFKLVDLPGTYSLGAFSEDEVVARDFILMGNPDIVINVVDATNLERNLYLTSQLLEMGANVVVALNMMDETSAKDIKIDVEKLSKSLGVPVVPTIASKEKGKDDLIETVIKSIEKHNIISNPFTYGEEIDTKLDAIDNLIKDNDFGYPHRWVSLKVLEGDEKILHVIKKTLSENDKNTVLSFIEEENDYEIEIVDKRYEFINKLIKSSVKKPSKPKETITDKIDKFVTNKYLGIPIFALVMFLVFQVTFLIGEDLLGGYVGGFIETLAELSSNGLSNIGAPEWVMSFVSDGLFGGLGAVFEFIPLILVLYFFLGILEDTGYMARAAYVMDGFMRKLGLHGKSFIPMIIGFGCNVPGIMATRTLENKKDRMITILINPFMSCGAKIHIYLVFVAAFFPNNGGLVLFALYALGIIVALIMGKIFSKTLFKGESSDFIMELPPYRLPIFKYVVRDMLEKVGGFVKRAGTIIFAMVAILWVLSVLPMGVEPHSQESILGQIGTFIAPIFKPAGFGTWQAAVSLFTGIAAKEAVVATLGMVYAGVEEGALLVETLQQVFTPLSAISFMVMTLLYTPCTAAIAAIKKETNSYKWALFAALYTFFVGWVVAVLIFQVGSLLGF